MITLTAGAASVVLAPEAGGAIAGWTVGAWPILRPPQARALVDGNPRGLGAFPLVPFSNRIAGARFAFAGRSWQLARNFGDSPHAIHGVGWQRAWEIDAIGQATARLGLRHRPEGGAAPAWPFAFDAAQRFALAPDRLTVGMRLVNRHDGPAPAGLGLHPYFPRTPGATLRFAAAGVWRNTPAMLPEAHGPVPPDWDHRTPRRVGSAVLDNSFDGWDGRAEIALAPGPVTIAIEAGPIFRHLVVFTPPGADFFCVEPVSHLTDALNRPEQPGTGLVVLPPGGVLEGEIVFRLDGVTERPGW